MSEPRCDWCSLSKPTFKDERGVVWHRTGWAGTAACRNPPAEAAQGAASPLYAIPGWLAEEEGGTYYRSEDVDALLASQGIWIAEGTGPIEAHPEAAQGAAPLDTLDDLIEAERNSSDRQAVFDAMAEAEGAAPRAEGLDTNLLGRAIHRVFRHGVHGPGADDGDGDLAAAILDEYAELAASRPSDERVPESEEPR